MLENGGVGDAEQDGLDDGDRFELVSDGLSDLHRFQKLSCLLDSVNVEIFRF